jgi:hypothetical protein
MILGAGVTSATISRLVAKELRTNGFASRWPALIKCLTFRASW